MQQRLLYLLTGLHTLLTLRKDFNEQAHRGICFRFYDLIERQIDQNWPYQIATNGCPDSRPSSIAQDVFEELRLRYTPKWESYSGQPSYPIPSPYPNTSPQTAYYLVPTIKYSSLSHYPKETMEYLKLRLAYLDFLIDTYQELIWELS